MSAYKHGDVGDRFEQVNPADATSRGEDDREHAEQVPPPVDDDPLPEWADPPTLLSDTGAIIGADRKPAGGE